MERWQCCRTCLAMANLNPIFQMQDHHEKYSQVILEATGIKINFNDSLPQQICTACVNMINESYRFRKKCHETQNSLDQQIHNIICDVKVEGVLLQPDEQHSIDISNLTVNFNVTNDYNLPLDDSCQDVSLEQEIDSKNRKKLKTIEKNKPLDHNVNFDVEYNLPSDDNSQDVNLEEEIDKKRKEIDSKKRRKSKKIEKNKTGRTLRVRKTDKQKEKKDRVKEEIKCEYCHKILTSKLSLRNHYKIHTGFDVVCEHCGKKFITRRLLLMHCKAKHGYEKTDKCSFCDYRASNAEQVKIHERLHTGEKPYVCSTCGAGFHRKSSYLQHVAIHLPEKTVPCSQCPARFKSVTLMRIHANRHRAAQYTYKCVVCAHNFARRRNVARHLLRIHAMQPAPEHIERSKCV